jgi:hypothetical protein
VRELKTLAPNGIQLNQEIDINSMVFADDQVIQVLAATENNF